MATFYSYDKGSSTIFLYSERGLFSYFAHHSDVGALLADARSSEGRSLSSRLGTVLRCSIFTEFELGGEGFGSPDAAIVVEHAGPDGELMRTLIFVEGKATSFDASFEDPASYSVSSEAIRLGATTKGELEERCRKNQFNSSINGQLELRWRFRNALRDAVHRDSRLVTERAIVPASFFTSDRFYWRSRLNPQVSVSKHWRRVHMSRGLGLLYESMKDASVLLLAVTEDPQIPSRLSQLRLYDLDGKSLRPEEFVFWLPLSHISRHVRRHDVVSL